MALAPLSTRTDDRGEIWADPALTPEQAEARIAEIGIPRHIWAWDSTFMFLTGEMSGEQADRWKDAMKEDF